MLAHKLIVFCRFLGFNVEPFFSLFSRLSVALFFFQLNDYSYLSLYFFQFLNVVYFSMIQFDFYHGLVQRNQRELAVGCKTRQGGLDP